MFREPLFWFVLIGALLFTADQFSAPDPVTVDESVRSQIASLWETQMGMAPTEKELESLVHNWVREEVFYREAMPLGLDNEDTIIRRRLVQKLNFLAQEVDESSITAGDVSDFYKANIDDYTLPVRYSISQIYFSNADRSDELKEALKAGSEWNKLGESSLLPRTLIRKSQREVTSTFGVEFSAQLNVLVEGQWIGPVSSTFGHHLVRLDALSPVEVTPLAYVEKQVLTDLLHQRREDSLDSYYESLLDQYEVIYE